MVSILSGLSGGGDDDDEKSEVSSRLFQLRGFYVDILGSRSGTVQMRSHNTLGSG